MSRKQPRVLTITPTYEPQKRLLPDVLFNIANQKYQNYDALVLVNNSPDAYLTYVQREIGDLEIQFEKRLFLLFNIGTIPQKGDYKGSISTVAYNHGLDYAMKYGYDYALLVPGDIALPDGCIRAMLNPFRKFKDCGISCLTCFFRLSGKGGMQGIMDKITEVYRDLKGEVDQKAPMIIPCQKDYPMDRKKYYRKKYLKCMAGDGAMMIPRRVFSKLRLRDHLIDFPDLGYKGVGADYAYCLDTLEAFGLYTYINTSTYTPHMHLEKGELVVY